MKTIMKNMSLALWAVVVSFLLSLTACQDYSIDSQAEGSPKLVTDALEQYNALATHADNVAFLVSANTPWEITVTTEDADKDWCKVTPGSSSTSSLVAEVIVSFKDNESNLTREATLTLSAEEVAEKKIIKIIQDSKADLYVTGDAKNQEFVKAGEAKNLLIRANRDWTISYVKESDKSWLHLSKYEASLNTLTETMVKVTADANEEAKREAELIVKTATQEIKVNILQKGAKLEVTPEELEKVTSLPAESGVVVIPVNTDMANWNAVVKGEADWIKNLKVDNKQISFELDQNIVLFPRSAEIALTTASGTEAFLIPLTQSHATFYCYGKGNTTEVAMPEGRFTERGFKLMGNDEFRVAFPNTYKRGTFVWEIDLVTTDEHPFTITGASNYDLSKVPNTHINFASNKNVVTGPNDWRVNNGGKGWWLTWQKVNVLKKQYKDIKKVELTFGEASQGDITLKLYNAAGEVLAEKKHTAGTEDEKWVKAEGMSYSMYFHGNFADENDYCIIKSFKAVPLP
ncbi:hypothetical protein, secreted [gut metagenome]|uniref:BACON domain-containing protein n=1 Tax=gut metagenome TaxID=749906 RepID=J9H2D5_9ZZZZ